MIAMHMRLHSFTRKDITDSLIRDGLDTDVARHIARWIYTPQGTMELFRQCAQRSIIPEPGNMLKKPIERERKQTKTQKAKKIIKRLFFDVFGNLVYGEKYNKDNTLKEKRRVENLGVGDALHRLDSIKNNTSIEIPKPFTRKTGEKQKM